MTLNLWDVTTGTHEKRFHGDSGRRNTLWLNGDEVTLASTDNNHIRLSDLITGDEKKTLKGHTKSVKSVSFSADGQTLASGSYDTTIRLWDVATGVHKKTLKGHKKSINSMAFSADGRMLVSASRDDTVRLWNVATGKLKNTFKKHTA